MSKTIIGNEFYSSYTITITGSTIITFSWNTSYFFNLKLSNLEPIKIIYDWGDGTKVIFSPYYSNSISHTYVSQGSYVIKIQSPYVIINDFYGTYKLLKNAKYIDISNNNLFDLPLLPTNIISLFVNNNNLSNINIPSSVLNLSCNHNNLTGMTLPTDLIYLDCAYNNISDLPVLSNLEYLDASYNNLSTTTIDRLLNEFVTNGKYDGYCNLYCSNHPSYYGLYDATTLINRGWSVILNPEPTLIFSGQSLSVLPYLPEGVISLDCSHNNLTFIELPNSLQTLICNDNKLNILNLPSGITYLNYNKNEIKLDSFPTGLTYLNCGDNLISYLPTLPIGLNYLNIADNLISTDLTNLPSSLTYLNINNNEISNLDDILYHLVNNGLSGGTANLKTTYYPTTEGLWYRTTLMNNLWTVNINVFPSLDLRSQGLSTLPYLPEGLQYLYFGYNDLTNIPTLPNSLIELDCSNNDLSIYEVERILTFLTYNCDSLNYVNICSQVISLSGSSVIDNFRIVRPDVTLIVDLLPVGLLINSGNTWSWYDYTQSLSLGLNGNNIYYWLDKTREYSIVETITNGNFNY